MYKGGAKRKGECVGVLGTLETSIYNFPWTLFRVFWWRSPMKVVFKRKLVDVDVKMEMVEEFDRNGG